MPPGRTRAHRSALRRARSELAAANELLRLARALAGATTSIDAAQRIAEALPSIVRCDEVGVLLPDDHGHLGVLGRFGRDDAIARTAHAVIDGPLVADVAELPELLIRHRDAAPAELGEAMDTAGIATVAVLAVRHRDELRAAVVALWSGTAAPPDDGDLAHRLRSVADLAGSTLDNARVLDSVRHRALHDALTGLPNQSLFNDRAAHAVARARRNGERVAVGVLDLDRFKTVNDSLGHRAGDALLIQVANRLHTAVRAPDTVARMGGDEFTLLLPELQAHGEAIVAERLLAAFEAPFDLDGHQIRVTPSIGLASYPADGDTPDQLLRSADVAMYRAKENGRNTWATYASGMTERAFDRLTLEADLARALERRELHVMFQPVTTVDDARPVGVEALVRWSHPSFGILGPGEFLPLAEEVGLVTDIDGWVLRQACLELGRADAAGGSLTHVAVNLSARTLVHPSVLRIVSEALAAGGLPPDRLVIEVTETALARGDERLLAALGELRRLGVAVALDDFGRGHSPLASLADLPLDLIKIDGAFLANVRTEDHDAPVVSAVVAMAHGLGLRVVAEGVETVTQLAFVRRLGCDLAQGFLLGRATTHAYAPEGASATAASSTSTPP